MNRTNCLLQNPWASVLVAEGALGAVTGGDGLQDKTLVARVSPSNLTQRAGSVLTIEDSPSHFDGIISGEQARRGSSAPSVGNGAFQPGMNLSV